MVSLKRKHQKRILFIFLSLAVVFLLAGFLLRLKTYKADLSTQKSVSIAKQQTVSYYFFEPTVMRDSRKGPPLIIYGGGLVETQAYAYLAASLAENGYPVYLLKSPLNLPILNQDQALQVIEQHDLQDVHLIGHSLGGVAASAAASSTDTIKGLILLASYPSEKIDLSQSKLAVLSITADHDQVLNWKAYEQASERLPKSTQFVTISGGNHSGFGLYGQQNKDGQAIISPQEQQDQLVSLIADFLSAKS